MAESWGSDDFHILPPDGDIAPFLISWNEDGSSTLVRIELPGGEDERELEGYCVAMAHALKAQGAQVAVLGTVMLVGGNEGTGGDETEEVLIMAVDGTGASECRHAPIERRPGEHPVLGEWVAEEMGGAGEALKDALMLGVWQG